MYIVAGRTQGATFHPGPLHPDQAARGAAAGGGGAPIGFSETSAPAAGEARRRRLRNGLWSFVLQVLQYL